MKAIKMRQPGYDTFGPQEPLEPEEYLTKCEICGCLFPYDQIVEDNVFGMVCDDCALNYDFERKCKFRGWSLKHGLLFALRDCQ